MHHSLLPRGGGEWCVALHSLLHCIALLCFLNKQIYTFCPQNICMKFSAAIELCFELGVLYFEEHCGALSSAKSAHNAHNAQDKH